MKRLTMDDIAKNLNISKSLVSLALSDKYGVSEEMKSRIRLYAMENGYNFKNIRTTKSSSHKTVSVIISDTEMFKEEFWSKVIVGIEKKLTDERIKMNILPCRNLITFDMNFNTEKLVKQVVSINPDGILLVSRVATQNNALALKKLNIPIVLVDNCSYIGSDIDNVTTDNYNGGYNAAKYLVEMGHKNLCFVGDPNYASAFKQRLNGFRDFCETLPNLKVDYLIKPDDGTKIHSYNNSELVSYLCSIKEHVAFMCANDPIAFEIYKLCSTFNLKISKDLSVLGFDDVETCTLLSPPLSSIHVHKYMMGINAASKLITRMNDSTKPSENMQLSTYISPKKSVADLTNNTD